MAVDVLVVGTGATSGWRAAVAELSNSLARSGVGVRTVLARPGHEVPTFMLTDLAQARVLRRAAGRGIAEHRPRAIIYCSITAALLWPEPGAIWLDSLARENRPGRHGLWQRVVERRRLERAPLVLTMSERSLAPLGESRPESVVVPVPVAPSGPPVPVRDVDVLAYAGDPVKRRLDLVLESWARARRGGETLVVAGPGSGRRIPGVRFAADMTPAQYREIVRRTRVFVAAPRREDYGIAPLEALAEGCMLVTTPSPGPYPALELARALDPRLVSEDLATAIRAALDDPLPGYGERARELLAPFGHDAVDATVVERVLPRLLPGFTP